MKVKTIFYKEPYKSILCVVLGIMFITVVGAIIAFPLGYLLEKIFNWIPFLKTPEFGWILIGTLVGAFLVVWYFSRKKQ